jgi:hypothetical protein
MVQVRMQLEAKQGLQDERVLQAAAAGSWQKCIGAEFGMHCSDDYKTAKRAITGPRTKGTPASAAARVVATSLSW